MPGLLIKVAILLRALLCSAIRRLWGKAPPVIISAMARTFLALLALRPRIELPADASAFLAEHSFRVRFVEHELIKDHMACYNVAFGGVRLRPRAAVKLGIPDGEVWLSEVLRPYASYVLFHEVTEMFYRARGFLGLMGHQLAEEEELLRWHADTGWLEMNERMGRPHLVALARCLRALKRVRIP